MRVLIIDNSRYVTGALKSIVNYSNRLKGQVSFFWALTKELDKTEFSSLVQSPQYFEFTFLELRKNLKSVFLYLPVLLINAVKILRLVNKHSIEVVHVNDMYNFTGLMVKLFRPKTRLIYHVRLLPSSYLGQLYGFYLFFIRRFADKIICNSEIVFNAIGNMDKKVVLYNSEHFDAVAAENTNPIRPEVKTILYIGNVVRGKGHDLAIKAFNIIARQHKDVQLEIAGLIRHDAKGNEYLSYLNGLIKEYNLEGRVIFKGYCRAVNEEIVAADIVLNMSESESFSRVCLEALKYGTPLVASDCGGPAEIFEHNISGFLVPNKDWAKAAEYLSALIDDVNKRARFSVEGQAYVRGKFDIENNFAKLLDIYAGRL